jgi:hypothetical protein
MIAVRAPQGVVGPELVNRATGRRVRVLEALEPGEEAKLCRDPEGSLRATIARPDGASRTVPPSHLITGPLGAQEIVPFAGKRYLHTASRAGEPALQLNDPSAPAVVSLSASDSGSTDDPLSVTVDRAQLRLGGPGDQPALVQGASVRLVGRVRPASAADSTSYVLADGSSTSMARLRAGPGVAIAERVDRAVVVWGPCYLAQNGLPLVIVQRVADLFDVTMHQTHRDGTVTTETHNAVLIGFGQDDPDDLIVRINAQLFARGGGQSSRLVRATQADKVSILTLPLGRSDWTYLDCGGARFDQATFNTCRFPDGRCAEPGVFDVSLLADGPAVEDGAVFAAAGAQSGQPVSIRFTWSSYQPGTFQVNLPADLPESFGGRFNQARFALPAKAAETYKAVTLEPAAEMPPEQDGEHLAAQVNARSALVRADVVESVPPGWRAQTVPFSAPLERTLTGGGEGQTAALYLAQEGVSAVVVITAALSGAWGDNIAVAVRPAGPARYDVSVSYQGARFENARAAALGVPSGAMPASTDDVVLDVLTDNLVKASPVGVLKAKAAGVRATVTRDRA